jgi:hypothetical protein
VGPIAWLIAWAIEKYPIPVASFSWGRASVARAKQQVAVKACPVPWSRRKKISMGIDFEKLKPAKAAAVSRIDAASIYFRLKVSIAGAEINLKTRAVMAYALATIPITAIGADRNSAYIGRILLDIC